MPENQNNSQEVKQPLQEEDVAFASWFNETNIRRFQLGYKIFLGMIVAVVIINVLIPVYLRRDESYTVTKSGCFGFDVNNICIGFTTYSREVRKSAIFE